MDILKLLYGVDTPEGAIETKTGSPQRRAFAGGNDGPLAMSADECRRLCKASNGLEYLSGYESRVRRYIVTDETVDRYGDIVRAKGVQFDNYRKNPVIQYAHNYDLPPVGNSIKQFYDKDSGGVVSWALFFDNRVDSSGRSELIYKFVSANAMRACSIGFMPLAWNSPKTDDERAKIGLGQYGVEFTSVDMLEFSPCPIPANPNALGNDFVEAWQKSLFTVARSGLFTAQDVDVMRKEPPIISTAALDVFINEIGGARVPVTFSLAETADAPPAEAVALEAVAVAPAPVVNITLDIGAAAKQLEELTVGVVALKKTMDDVKSQVEETLDQVLAVAKRTTAQSAEPVESVSSLYDAIRGKNGNY